MTDATPQIERIIEEIIRHISKHHFRESALLSPAPNLVVEVVDLLQCIEKASGVDRAKLRVWWEQESQKRLDAGETPIPGTT